MWLHFLNGCTSVNQIFFFFFKFTLAAVFTIKFFFSYMRYAEMQPIKFPCLLRAELDARVCPREFI